MNRAQKVLVCGSISYDTIMRTRDRFRDHILPSTLDCLNLAFPVAELHRGFGGCATNICYSLNQLDYRGLPVATVGTDFERYREWLDAQGIERDFILAIDGQSTPRDYITNDRDNRQIAAFHHGAMDFSHENPIADLRDTALGLISPDGLEGMRLHARQFAEAGVPFLLDPGQVTPLFPQDHLLELVERARWAIFNDYEWRMFESITGLGHEDLAARVEAHVVTAGAEGSTIYVGREQLVIAAGRVANPLDPTGCGDAYRAGLVVGLLNDLDWRETGQLASTIGAVCCESEGSQRHQLVPAELYSRYREDYGESEGVRGALGAEL